VPEINHESLALAMAEDLAEIARTHMPFGKYGPAAFPPRGRPIYELPSEYLGWFERNGWPSGRLGELLKMVYQMKVDGSGDVIFAELKVRLSRR
jgi:uncharacterized protein (DUF3820 family)